MKNKKRKATVIIGLMIGMLVFSGCDNESSFDAQNPGDYLEVQADGTSSIDYAALRVDLSTLPYEELSEAETNSLVFMREEEKLARDVYMVMYDQWGPVIFDKISKSEQTHMDAILLLLEKYGVEDPISDVSNIGTFENQTLQNLYNDLIAQGSISDIEALKVGAVIEEIDILDLMNILDEVVDNEDITLVFDNLLRGSRNHLRAYYATLLANDVTYEAQYMDSALFEEIVSSPMEKGGNGQGGNGNGFGGQGNGHRGPGNGGNGNATGYGNGYGPGYGNAYGDGTGTCFNTGG